MNAPYNRTSFQAPRYAGGLGAALLLAIAALSISISTSLAEPSLTTQFLASHSAVSDNQQAQTNSTAFSLSDESAGSGGGSSETGSATVSYGSAALTGYASGTSSGAAVTMIVQSNDDIVIAAPGVTYGVMHLTMHDSIAYSGNADSGTRWEARWGGSVTASSSVAYDGATITGQQGSDTAVFGTPPAALETYSVDLAIGFNVTTSLQIKTEIDVSAQSSPPPPSVSASLSMSSFARRGAFTVTDSGGAPVAFTAESRTGSARGGPVAAGSSYTGITLTNNAPGRLGSSMAILAGSAGTNTNIAAAFVPPPDTTSPAQTCGVFSDVASTDPFFAAVQYVACRGVMGGYSDGTFRPLNDLTRGQMAAAVSKEEGFTDTVSGQTFADVPPGSPYYVEIERMALHGLVSGYPCGVAPDEPCDAQSRPYFRPSAPVTRAQLAKVISNAAGYSETPSGQTFADVPPEHAFFTFIERVALHGIMKGYPCGGAGETCDDQNRPYFRPFNNVTRAQLAQVLANLHGGSGSPQLVSDAVDLTGTGNDVVVVQVSYNSALAKSLFGSDKTLRLGWLKTATRQWVNAVEGNIGGSTPQFFPRAYNPATDFHLGYHGVDSVKHVAWAVVNHNSVFGVLPLGGDILSIAHPAANTIHLECEGVPNSNNTIEWSPDLSPSSFTALTSVLAGETGGFTVDDTNAGTKKFYRLALP